MPRASGGFLLSLDPRCLLRVPCLPVCGGLGSGPAARPRQGGREQRFLSRPVSETARQGARGPVRGKALWGRPTPPGGPAVGLTGTQTSLFGRIVGLSGGPVSFLKYM